MSGEARYDPVANPFAPGAGTPPPALVGRDRELQDARVSLDRIRAQRSSQHLLVHGLRGVGKTVLLRALSGIAEQQRFHTVRIEGAPGSDAVAPLVRQTRRLLADLRPTPRVKRALRVLASVSVSLGIAGLRVDAKPQPGVGDSGVLVDDLADLVLAVAAAAGDQDGGLFIAVDEAQALSPIHLGSLLGVLHMAGQEQAPVWSAMAGLPNLLALASRAKTYAERMFTVAELGPLPPAAAAQAITAPAEELSVAFAADAVDRIVGGAAGYPYF